jgi:PAS domain S-box-containing protein
VTRFPQYADQPYRQEQPTPATTDRPSGAGTGAEQYPPDLVFIVGADGQILFVNRDLGGVSPDEVIGSSLFDWIFPEQHALVRERLRLVFETGQPQGHELAGFYPHSPDSWYECRLAPSLRDGAVVSATIVARDITHHRRARQEAERRYAELSRMYEERTADLARANAALAAAAEQRDSGSARQLRLLALLDASGEAVFVSDPETGKILDVNETACRWLQKSRDEIVGSRAHALGLGFPIQLTEDQDLQFTETRDTRRPVFVNGVHYRQDGSTFPVESAIARHDLGGGGSCFLAVARDVKDRQQTLVALRQREAAFRDLFRLVSDAVYLTTRSGEIVAVNDAAVTLFGYSRDELLGMDARVLFSGAADIRRFQATMAEHDGVARNVEVELRTKSGAIVPGLLSATRRQSPEGTIQGYQVLVRRTAAPALATGEPPAADGEQVVRPRILVADASAATLAVGTEVLERAGFSVFAAESHAQALDLLRQHAGEVAAVVLGVEQGERGIEHTVEELHRIDAGTPVIVSSADDRLSLADRLAGLEIAGYVERPPHPLALVQKVRDVLGQAAPE